MLMFTNKANEVGKRVELFLMKYADGNIEAISHETLMKYPNGPELLDECMSRMRAVHKFWNSDVFD